MRARSGNVAIEALAGLAIAAAVIIGFGSVALSGRQAQQTAVGRAEVARMVESWVAGLGVERPLVEETRRETVAGSDLVFEVRQVDARENGDGLFLVEVREVDDSGLAGPLRFRTYRRGRGP